ncbi:MAG: hypothetical protein NZT92_13570 [Abditibacteriales bacterium]|nr:hypothetical protein [Abditibacteriales bacterium]MDW8366724.1 hypothetical protein [Abditibacteriales bacterium]
MAALQVTIERTTDGYIVTYDDLYGRGVKNRPRKPLSLDKALARVKEALERLPPTPDVPLSQRYAKELKALERLSDAELEAWGQTFMPKAHERRFSVLLRKAAQGRLTEKERRELEVLSEEFLRISALKTRASALQQKRREKTSTPASR